MKTQKILRPVPANMNGARSSLANSRTACPDARPTADVMLPNEAPLAMPEQQFARRFKNTRDPNRRESWIPRAAISLATLLLTLAFAIELHAVLSPSIITPMQVAFLVLSTTAFGWITLGTLNSVFGFLHLHAGTTPDTIELPDARGALFTKTALLFPVYKESPTDIAGTIAALADHLRATGHQNRFDVFVLSDTPVQAPAQSNDTERATFEALKQELAGELNIYYRRRSENTAKKSGNIQDWVERFGARYENFVILDADSVMSGQTLVQLARAMEQTPKAGLIQTVPKLAGARTLFQRLQQFASNVYGPAAAVGLAAWHGDEGNYWGHNAIIRTKAFAGAAGLPVLKGRAPFGGHIQSHDFVEAALMQRAGWAIHMAPTTPGSFEGSPPSLPEIVARDRRWAQGNLQHLLILPARGLTTMGRIHLLFGATSYLIAMVWALSLVIGIALALQGSQMIPTYFTDEKTLFPIWPVTNPGASLRLFAATAAVVLFPKFLGAVLEIRRARAAREVGGTPRAIAGVFVETLFSMLLAPILMVTQTVAVAEILIGRDSGWSAQTREGQALTIVEAQRAFGLATIIGIVATAVCWYVSIELTAWMSPILAGLLFAGPIAWVTSRQSHGLLAAILSTPEDRTQPAILDHTNRYQRSWAERLADATSRDDEATPVPVQQAA